MPGLGIGTQPPRRRNRGAASPDIQAIVLPASSDLPVGRALQDTVNWAVFTDPANYVTTAPGASIDAVTVNYIGSTATAADPLADGDVNSFSITVSGTSGPSRTFTVLPRLVRNTPPSVAGPLAAQSLTQSTGIQSYDASVGFTGLDLVFSVSGPIGVSIDAASGLLAFDTSILPVQTGGLITVTATNSGGSAQSNLDLTVIAPAVYAAGVTGLIDNPTYGQTAQIGSVLTGNVTGLRGGETLQHRWRANGTLIPGATASSYTPDAAEDLQLLQYSPLVDTQEVTSPAYQVRHAPPTAGSLVPVTQVQGSGAVAVNLAAGFTGQALVYSESANWASIAGDILTIADEERIADLAIVATNSGGFATLTLSVSITAPAALSAVLDPSGAQALTSNQRGQDIANLAVFLDPGNYTSTLAGETITAPEFQVNGVAAPDTLYFDVGDEVAIRVTGSLGTEARYVIDSSVAAPSGTTAVFLLIGQSNMVGRPAFDGGAGYPAGTIQYNQSNLRVPASTPLDHIDEMPGDMGLALQFVIDYKAANPTHDVVLVPRAQGNTGFQDGRWIAGSGTNYLDALADVNALMAAHPSYSFAGFLWHQGEADVAAGAGAYADRLNTMIDAFRSNVTGASDTTPFVMGELFSNAGERDEINSLIQTVGDAQAYCTVASAAGLATEDTVHFDAASLRLLGARYFAAYEAARTDIPAVPGPVPGLSATAGSGQVSLTWDLPATNGAPVMDYLIEYTTDGGANWTMVLETVSTQRSYTLEGLVNGTSYAFRVRAVNAVGTGQPSASASAVPTGAAGPFLLAADWAESAPGSTSGASSADVTMTLDVGPQNSAKSLFVTVAGLIDEGEPLTLTVGGASATALPGGGASTSNVALYPFRLDAPALSGPQPFVLSGFTQNRLDVGISCVAVAEAGTAVFASDFAGNATGTVSIDVPGNGGLIATGLNANGGATALSGVAVQTDGTSATSTPGGDDIRSGEVFSAGYQFDLSEETARTISAASSGGQVLGVIAIAPVAAAGAGGFALETIGEEPVLTVSDGALSVTIGSGLYAGTYTQRATDGAALTVAMIEAAPTCIVLPTISGTETEGEMLTGVAGLWVYDGPDAGDQTFSWVNTTDGTTGDTDLSYVIQAGDVGDAISLDETYGGVTVSSASTGTISGVGVTFPVTTSIANTSTDTNSDVMDYSGAFTPAAGTNRMLWCIVQWASNADCGSVTATLNGTAFTEQGAANETADFRCAYWAGYLLDADISAGTLGVDFSKTNGQCSHYSITIVELDGVNQSTPVGDTVTRTDFGSSNSVTNRTLTNVSGGSRALIHAGHRSEGDYTVMSNGGGTITELRDNAGSVIALEEWAGVPPSSVEYIITRDNGSTQGPSLGIYEINEA